MTSFLMGTEIPTGRRSSASPSKEGKECGAEIGVQQEGYPEILSGQHNTVCICNKKLTNYAFFH